jgi:hypothetical protein
VLHQARDNREIRDCILPLHPAAFGGESLRRRIIKLLAANRVYRFLPIMVLGNFADSKLSAWNTRQRGGRSIASPVGQLGKGETPVASPVRRLRRRAETVPVSVPSGFGIAVREVHP